MGIVFRQSVKTLIVVFVGAILGAFIIWLSTKYIPKQQLGFTNSLTTFAVTASQFILVGFNHTMAVYINRYANDDRKRKLLLTLCFGIPLIVLLIFSIFYLVFKSWVVAHFQTADAPLMYQYYAWLPVYILFFVYQVLLEQYLNLQLKVAISSFMREVLLRILNIVLLLLFAFEFISFHVFVISTILVYTVHVSIFFLLSLNTDQFGFSLRLRDFSKEEYKHIGTFCAYHALLPISIVLISTMDILLLPFYDHNGFASVAVYRVAVFLISFMLLPTKALIPATHTMLSRAFAEGNKIHAADIFVRASINILIPTIGISVILFCNLNNIILLIKDGYVDIMPVFTILLLGNIVNIACGMNDQVLSITNYYKFNFFLSLIVIAFLYVLIRLFVPQNGIYGAAWSTTVAIILFSLAKVLFVWRKLDMQPFSRSTALVLIAALPALAAGYFFPHFLDQSRHIYVRTFVDASIRSLIIIAVYMLMLIWLKPSKDLVEYIASVRKNKRLY